MNAVIGRSRRPGRRGPDLHENTLDALVWKDYELNSTAGSCRADELCVVWEIGAPAMRFLRQPRMIRWAVAGVSALALAMAAQAAAPRAATLAATSATTTATSGAVRSPAHAATLAA